MRSTTIISLLTLCVYANVLQIPNTDTVNCSSSHAGPEYYRHGSAMGPELACQHPMRHYRGPAVRVDPLKHCPMQESTRCDTGSFAKLSIPCRPYIYICLSIFQCTNPSILQQRHPVCPEPWMPPEKPRLSTRLSYRGPMGSVIDLPRRNPGQRRRVGLSEDCCFVCHRHCVCVYHRLAMVEYYTLVYMTYNYIESTSVYHRVAISEYCTLVHLIYNDLEPTCDSDILIERHKCDPSVCSISAHCFYRCYKQSDLHSYTVDSSNNTLTSESDRVLIYMYSMIFRHPSETHNRYKEYVVNHYLSGDCNGICILNGISHPVVNINICTPSHALYCLLQEVHISTTTGTMETRLPELTLGSTGCELFTSMSLPSILLRVRFPKVCYLPNLLYLPILCNIMSIIDDHTLPCYGIVVLRHQYKPSLTSYGNVSVHLEIDNPNRHRLGYVRVSLIQCINMTTISENAHQYTGVLICLICKYFPRAHGHIYENANYTGPTNKLSAAVIATDEAVKLIYKCYLSLQCTAMYYTYVNHYELRDHELANTILQYDITLFSLIYYIYRAGGGEKGTHYPLYVGPWPITVIKQPDQNHPSSSTQDPQTRSRGLCKHAGRAAKQMNSSVRDCLTHRCQDIDTGPVTIQFRNYFCTDTPYLTHMWTMHPRSTSTSPGRVSVYITGTVLYLGKCDDRQGSNIICVYRWNICYCFLDYEVCYFKHST